MSSIKGKNTKPEILVRQALRAAGYRFRLHRKDLPGAPDVVLPGRRIAVFAHGCFWHMHADCKNAKLPSTRADFWRSKLAGNVERDSQAVEALRAQGWRVLTVWECGTRDRETLDQLPTLLSNWIEGDEGIGEVSAASRG